MKEITILRGDFRKFAEGDFFNDLIISLGLAKDYDEAEEYDSVEMVVDSSVGE